MCCRRWRALLIVIAIVSPALHGIQRSLLLGLGTRLQFLFFAVLVPVLVGEVIKWCVGRGRPFVGGEANVFNFSHFAGTQAYSSFPSGHAITAFALAFAVSAVWPRARVPMVVYALVIAATRLVLLAHHPSDVVAGALVGDHRRDVRAILVCGPPARICDPSRRHDCAPCRALVRAPQKGCPGRIRPIKADAARRPDRPGSGPVSNPTRRVPICLLPTELRSPFPSLCRCATKRTTSRR